MGNQRKHLIGRCGFDGRLINKPMRFEELFEEGICSGMRRQPDQRVMIQIRE